MARLKPAKTAANKQIVRCAIYTRKSTEEGLDQEFNSLDAQREACAAYISSQRHEGWVMLPDHYDDGGFSGGNMDRPGLKQLLAEVKAGRVDVIVVYKVDRLTRALSDFAKIVEVLDAAGASFVSITQAFNTTSSMGRLTLNVLLSFAQFEREVISERVRDKISASKRKGMWMGGRIPLGYDVIDRKLVINEAEAETVRLIYRRYLECGTVRELQSHLKAEGIRSKRQTWSTGRISGGGTYGKGALYHLLSNRLYRGEIVHNENIFPGEHEAIVPQELWDAVQSQMQDQSVQRHNHDSATEVSLLAGHIRDCHGRRMTPSHAAKGPRRYRYYVTPAEEMTDTTHRPFRIPAGEIELAVMDGLKSLLANPDRLAAETNLHFADANSIRNFREVAKAMKSEIGTLPQSARRRFLDQFGLELIVNEADIKASLDGRALLQALGVVDAVIGCTPRIAMPKVSTLVRRGPELRLVVAARGAGASDRDEGLISLLVKARQAQIQLHDLAGLNDKASIAARKEHTRLARFCYLAPDITAAILDGTQPMSLTPRQLLRTPHLPLIWAEQRQLLGFS
ncbi:recombinase family protein [Sphingobium phenoxybenzoativorans]|uniref:recombinase family protein n=1 Tax=Sphingobium phenoxybenzoativorans TaxID=1592790 RepID=UPI000871C771|nr:recombinase family protein [Sphingobium phenoxybenzoativorans]